MPVPEEIRERMSKVQGNEANLMKYMVATIEGKDIFLQEAEWVRHTGKPIPTGKLVAHKDGNTMNNEFTNLILVDENKEYGDLHQKSNKVFHEENVVKYEDFIKKHFPDIYDAYVDRVNNLC